MKIQIIGYSGAGKSTLARELAGRYALPVMYLDTVHWLPGWKERLVEEERVILGRFLDENTEAGWVIDGNYTKNLLERRMEEADLILYLNYPRTVCMARILKRYAQNHGKTRFSITDGCDEKLDWEFIRWVLWDSRTDEVRNRRAGLQARYPQKFHEFKSPRALREYLETME